MTKPLLLSLLLPLYGSAQSSDARHFELTGRFTGFTDGTKFFISSLGKEKGLDSASLENGEFSIRGTVAEPTVFRIFTGAGHYRAIWIEGGRIKITGDAADFSNAAITSAINAQAKVIEDMVNPLYARGEALYAAAEKESSAEKQQQLQIRAAATYDSSTVIRKRNIFSLPPSYPLMQELYFLRSSMSKDSLRLALERFPESIRKSGNGQALTNFAATATIKAGMQAPDISGKDISGNTVHLSSLKGKLVLLDFWAGWCGPCRKSNKQLVSLYREYKAKGFEIFSFNIDTRFELWNQASAADGISWINVSDLMGTYSPGAIQYNIQGIPKAFLIDKDGIIREIINGYSAKHHDLILQYLDNL